MCGNFDSLNKSLPVLIFHRLWIKEVEMVDSLDELKSSRSVSGKNFPIFEMRDAKIASALNKIIQNFQFNRKVSLEEQKAQKEDWILRGRQIAFMIYDCFRVTCAHDRALDYADVVSTTLHDDDVFRSSIQDCTKFYYRCQRFHPMTSWKVCTSGEYVSPHNSKPYWYCTTWRFIKRDRFPTIES